MNNEKRDALGRNSDEVADCQLKAAMIHGDDGCSLRFEKRHGTRWMLENKCVIKKARNRYLQIMDLGLGVIEVRLRPADTCGTIVVKKWEKVV